MVSKTVCFSLVVFAVLVMITAAKPFSEEDKADEILSDKLSPPCFGDGVGALPSCRRASYSPKVRMNRHGRRGLFDDLEEQDSDDLSGSNEYYADDNIAADGPPPRIRINRHGKRGLFDNMEERDFEGETEYVLSGARGTDLADGPQRLRMNRHGK